MSWKQAKVKLIIGWNTIFTLSKLRFRELSRLVKQVDKQGAPVMARRGPLDYEFGLAISRTLQVLGIIQPKT